MANCTYRFTDANGKTRVIKGQAAFKAYLASGGLEHLLPGTVIAPALSARQTETPAFKKWFGDSKVVDANGDPLVVYHGAKKKFNTFDMSKALDGAMWFATDPKHADFFAQGKEGNVVATYLSLKNPMVISQSDLDSAWDVVHPDGEQDDRSLLPRDFVEDFVVKARAAGNDGLVIEDFGDLDFTTTVYLAFKPSQIKSATDNVGTFDVTNPDIRFSQRVPRLDPEDVLKPSTIAAAEAAIKRYKKAEAPDTLTAQQRADGEALLKPLFDGATRNKPDFDKTLDQIAEGLGGYAKKPGIKGLNRAVTKLITENGNDPTTMKDLLRGTVVVNTFQEAQEAINQIGKVYTFDRIKNRLAVDLTSPDGAVLKGVPLSTGYQDILTNVTLEDGTVAEIQISTPEMLAAKNLGHEVYAFEREMGKSPVKTKMVDLQKQIYSEGYDAYLAREAKALKTRSNSALPTGSAFSRTSEGLRGSGAGNQAVAESQLGATVTGTSFQSKNMVPGGKDLKSKSMSPSIPESRANQKNPAASRVGNVSADRFKRTEQLQQAVADLQEGKITRTEYNRVVDQVRPVYPYKDLPKLTTAAEARYALANGRGQSPEKAAKYSLPSKTLKAGDWAQLRLDIPSYQEHDAWVVSVHTPKSTNREVQAAYDAGPVVGYESVGALTDATFGMNQKAAAKIATGTAKGTIATVLGKWKPISNAAATVRAKAAMKDPAWVQVGMDPFRHSYFYNRDTMQPIVRADEVIQIGPLVLAKNATYSEDADITGAPFAFSKREEIVQIADDAARQAVFLQQKAEEAGYETVDDFVDNDYNKFVEAAAQWREENPAEMMFQKRQPVGRETEGWIFSRDELGRFRFGAGAKAYRYAADIANIVLDKINLKPISPELSRALRKMKVEVEKAQNLTVDVAKNLKDLPKQEREMISDVIEGELKKGAMPPQRVLDLAASMQSIMSEQTAELVRLGMLSPQAAGRWDGKYLPRFYEQKLGDETKAWAKAVKGLLGRKKTMQGIRGSSLKARGMFQNVPVNELDDWTNEGWEVRDDNFDPAVDDTITVWRDYTRDERDDMGEIRDAMFRFVMGYNKSQRDIALGRLYENLASSYGSKREQPGYVQVPATKVEDTMVPTYGKLSGMWVPQEVLDQLSTFDQSMQNDLTKMYLKGLSMWKEGKTVLNPVAHANNVLSNLTMAHFAGVSYWDTHKYVGAIADLVQGKDMVQEASDAGLFGGTFNRAELMKVLPEELKAMAQMTESVVGRNVDRLWNALSLFLRKPMGAAYDAEDQFFRYLIYRDARNRGLDVDDAVDYAQKYIFTYDDLPKAARVIRDMPVGLPFFSYTFKAIPALANTALEHPFRYAAPAIALYTANALMYAMAASLGGGEDEDWWTVIRRYMTDEEFRNKTKEMEKQERQFLPEWMKGASLSLGTEKTIRLGMDDLTNLPVFLDVSRIFPGGDLFDAHNNAGGIPLLAPLTPNNPVLTSAAAMLFNKDTFRNKDIVLKTDTDMEAAQKRLAWTWKQVTPAIAVGNTHFERAMNVIANSTGQPVNVGLAEYTGIGPDGLPIQSKYAAMQTVGIKARPIDLDTSEQIQASQTKAMIRDLDTQIRKLKRLEGKGAITPESAEREREKLKQKKQFLKEGLNVEGEEKD